MIKGLVAAILVTCAALAAPAGADDDAIRGIVKTYIEARDRDDAKAVAALFTADADQLVSSGEWRKGREDVVKGTLASTRNGGKRMITIETIRYVTPGVAIADGKYELASDTGMRHMWSSFVLVKTAGSWKIAAIRNMLPAK
jgi:uncharacterized protein (TIGR02246 family)